MTRIGETALARAAARRARVEALARREETAFRRTLHPERDPFGPARGDWEDEAAAARERFRRAHVAAAWARDAEAALIEA